MGYLAWDVPNIYEVLQIERKRNKRRYAQRFGLGSEPGSSIVAANCVSHYTMLHLTHLNLNGYSKSGSPYSAACKLDICGKM